MSGSRVARAIVFAIGALAAVGLVGGCNRTDNDRVQGYAEGEFVYVASAYAGALEALHVRRGDQVKAGDPLFELESAFEKAARDEAERRVAQAKANFEDVKKGRRPTEIESMEAQLREARSALEFSDKELRRQESLARTRSGALEDLERARSAYNQDSARVSRLEADLKTARLGSREDQIAAAEANLRATQATLAKAEWDLAQKRQVAPQAGLVYDTLYYQGEWVAAGRPVVALLPPQNIKVRAFVPEQRIGAISVGQSARVIVDGVSEPLAGRVAFISPRAEYTPPVIYSRETRAKLVFMVELRFDPETAARLHPGQPVDVQFGP